MQSFSFSNSLNHTFDRNSTVADNIYTGKLKEKHCGAKVFQRMNYNILYDMNSNKFSFLVIGSRKISKLSFKHKK